MFLEELKDILLERITVAQRLRMRQRFRANKGKLAAGKRRAERRKADEKTLQKRAKAAARRKIESRILKGRSKSDLTFGEKERLEAIMKRRVKGVIRLARKLLPRLRKKEAMKFSKAAA